MLVVRCSHLYHLAIQLMWDISFRMFKLIKIIITILFAFGMLSVSRNFSLLTLRMRWKFLNLIKKAFVHRLNSMFLSSETIARINVLFVFRINSLQCLWVAISFWLDGIFLQNENTDFIKHLQITGSIRYIRKIWV